MTSLLALLALTGQDAPDWLGMTAEQVVRLGRDRFAEKYTLKHGYSTAAMSGAQTEFGAALKAVNDAWLDRQARSLRERADKLRPALERFQTTCYDVGVRLSGGGTMWNPVYAGTTADVEEAVASALGRTRVAKPIEQAGVWAGLARLEQKVRKDAADMDSMGRGGTQPSAEAVRLIASARSQMATIVPLAAQLPTSRRSAIWRFLADAAGTPLGMVGED